MPIKIDLSENIYFSVALDFPNAANVLSFITFEDKLLTSYDDFTKSSLEFKNITLEFLGEEVFNTEESYLVFQKSLFSMLSQINSSSMSGSVDRDDFTKIYNLR